MIQKLLLFLVLGFAGPAFSQSQKNHFHAFQTGNPEKGGFSSPVLLELFPYVRNQQVNIHSLMIIRDDKVLFDACFYPYARGMQHDIASCTKSVTSLLIGIAIDKGFIRDENELVRKYFPEIKSYSPNFETLTIKDLLTMSSGLDCRSNNEDALFAQLFKVSDWPAFIFHIPSISTPGKKFSYCSCNYYLLAEILFRATKQAPEKFADKYLFKPLDITHFYWTKNDKGINYGWGDLALKPHDMARIGRLLLNDGVWNGTRVISETYIRKATSIHIPLDGDEGYGYGFWVDNAHSFNAVGRGGQRIHVDRLYNAVVVAIGGGYNWDEKGGIDDIIGRSVHRNALPENRPAADSLQKAIAFAEKVESILPVKNTAANQEKILFNRQLIFEKNSLNISTARFLTVTGKDMVFRVTDPSGKKVDYPLPVGTAYRYFTDPFSKHIYAFRGYWKAPDEFLVDFNTLTKINKNSIGFKLKDKEIQVTIQEETQKINDTVRVYFEENK